MTGVSFDNAQLFIYKNARLLERRLFEALYCQGEKRAVVTALKAYQNADGGFGNALEPDVRCPDSQPVSAHVALETLDRVGLLTDPAVHDDVLLPLIGWLESVTTDEGGIPNVLPSANNYPHAPWWTAVDNPPADLNPTAAIVGLLLKSKVNHPWIARAAAYCFTAIEKTGFQRFGGGPISYPDAGHRIPDPRPRSRPGRSLTHPGGRVDPQARHGRDGPRRWRLRQNAARLGSYPHPFLSCPLP